MNLPKEKKIFFKLPLNSVFFNLTRSLELFSTPGGSFFAFCNPDIDFTRLFVCCFKNRRK